MEVSQIYYLHEGKKMTILDWEHEKCEEVEFKATSAPHLVEAHRDGVMFCSKSNELTHLVWKEGKTKISKLNIKSIGLGGNLSLKPQGDNFYLFNEYGLHYYCAETKKTYSQSCFDITNCGISLNK